MATNTQGLKEGAISDSQAGVSVFVSADGSDAEDRAGARFKSSAKLSAVGSPNLDTGDETDDTDEFGSKDTPGVGGKAGTGSSVGPGSGAAGPGVGAVGACVGCGVGSGVGSGIFTEMSRPPVSSGASQSTSSMVLVSVSAASVCVTAGASGAAGADRSVTSMVRPMAAVRPSTSYSTCPV